jgi:hypothetical protein
MTKASRGTNSRGTSVFLVGCLGCVPLNDLSSYSEGTAPEQSESLQAAPEQSPDNPGASPAGAVPVPLDMASSDEDSPVDAPLDPVPTDPTSTAAGPSNASPTVRTAAVDAGDDCTALGGFTISETSSCYLLGVSTPSWQEARSFCQAWGGDLVMIGSGEENEPLAQRIDGSVWIGANDVDEEGTFRWAGGGLVEYSAWAMGQPNDLMGGEDCSELNQFGDNWIDVACSGDVVRQALCEQAPSSAIGEDD